MRKIETALVLFAFFYLCSGVIGINWGIPSKERMKLVLPDGIKQETLYEALARNRQKIYDTSEKNPTAYHGKIKKAGKLEEMPLLPELPNKRYKLTSEIPKPILHSLSSYLVRSTEGDEQTVFSSIAKMRPEKLNFNPHTFQYGGIYLYSVAAALKLFDLANIITVESDITYYYKNPEEMGKFFVLGRMITTFSIFLSLFLIYLIAKELFDESTALWSVVIFILTPAVIVWSKIMKPHFFALPFACLSFYHAIRIYKTGKRRNYILSGIFAGLAAGAALNNLWLSGWAIFVAHVFRSDLKNCVNVFQKKGLVKSLLICAKHWSPFLMSCVFLGFFYLLSNPYLLVSFKEFLYELVWLSSFHYPHLNLNIFRDFLMIPLLHGLGYGFWFLFLSAIVYSFIKRTESDKFTLAYLLPIIILNCIISAPSIKLHSFIRLISINIVLMSVLSARLAVALVKKQRLFLIPVIVLFAVNIFTVYGYLLNFHLDGIRKSNDYAAGKWINENIPRGSSIGSTATMPHVDRVPPFRFTDYVILNFARTKEFKELEYLPEYFVIGENPAELQPGTKDKFTHIVDFDEHYEVIKYFNYGTRIFGINFRNMLCSANYPVKIYRRMTR